MSEIPAGDELTDLVFFALDHGIESVRGGGPLVPFAVTEGADGRNISRFVAETLEESVEHTRNHVRADEAAVRSAIAYDGYVTVEDDRSDAIVVEGHERGHAASVTFFQRYRPGGRLRRFTTLGNAGFLGEGDPLLRDGH